MAQKDIAQKLLEDYEDVFADIVNVLVFDGEEVVRPDALEASNLRSQYKTASDGMLHEQERDVVKYWKEGDLRIGLIGLENQIKVEREMVLRVLGYDGAAYRDQLRKISKKDKDVENATENEEETEKGKQLYPVLTLILYFGEEHWNKPKKSHGWTTRPSVSLPAIFALLQIFSCRGERIKITSRALRKFSMWMSFLSCWLHLQEIPHMGK